VVLGKDSLIEANEAELDPGHRVRGCAAYPQDPKPSRHDAVTASGNPAGLARPEAPACLGQRAGMLQLQRPP